MEIKTRYIASSMIELTCIDGGNQITVDVTNLMGFVDVDFIENLRQVANELEEHNSKLKNAIKNE